MPGFTDDAARRIIAATKKVEGSKLFELADSPHGFQLSGDFYAKITGKNGNKYSWVAVAPNASNTWVEHSEWGTGNSAVRYAIELNGEDVETNTIVKLYPATNNDYYVFSITPATGDDSGTQPNTGGKCCVSKAVDPAFATVTACGAGDLLPKYLINVPKLNVLKAPASGLLTPYVSVVLYQVSGCVFESDTQYYTDGDIYYYKLTVGATRDPWDSTLELLHGNGIGSGVASGSVGAQAIDSLVYSNPYYWDSTGGTIFTLVTDRNELPNNVATWFPCSLCINPTFTHPVGTCITGRIAPYPVAFIVEAISGVPSGVTVTPGVFMSQGLNPQWSPEPLYGGTKVRVDYTTCPNVDLGNYLEIGGLLQCPSGGPSSITNFYSWHHNGIAGWGFMAMGQAANVFGPTNTQITWDTATFPEYLSGTFVVSFYCYNMTTPQGNPHPSTHIGTATFRIREIN